MRIKIIAVVVTHNSERVISRCLTSLHTLRIPVVVVDNASTDATLNRVRGLSQVTLLSQPQNLGYAAGNNRGIEVATVQSPDYIMILNPDTVILKDAVESLVKAAQSYDDKGIFGPQILSEQTPHFVWARGGELDTKRFTAGLVGHHEQTRASEKIETCDFLSGTCLLLPRNVYLSGLRFFEPYFLYYEDVEFSFRARNLGFPAYCVLSSRILHREVSEFGKSKLKKEYYLARNHLLFIERNAPFAVQFREAVRLPYTLYQHYKKGEYLAIRGIRDYFFRHFYERANRFT